MQDPDLPLIQHIFEKRYDLTGYRKQDVEYVKKALGRESSIFQRLKHPHIVACLGCRDIEKDTPRLYLEYCDGGDLRDDVEPFIPHQATAPSPTPLPIDNPTVYDSGVDSPEVSSLERGKVIEPRTWSETQVWKLIYQLYSALAYLHYGVSISSEHEQCVYESSWDPIIHCDINPRNSEWICFQGVRDKKLCLASDSLIVVLSKRHDGELDAKICDLGVARDDTKGMSVAKGIGSLYYQPPASSHTCPTKRIQYSDANATSSCHRS